MIIKDIGKIATETTATDITSIGSERGTGDYFDFSWMTVFDQLSLLEKRVQFDLKI